MKKFSFFLNCAATVLFAVALTACQQVKDNPSGEDNPAKQTIEIKNGDELATIINQLAATAGDDIIVEIPAGIGTVYTGEIVVPAGKNLTIAGKGDVTIIPTASIVFGKGLTVKGVCFECNDFKNHLFVATKTPAEDLKIESGEYFIKDPVVFDDIVVKNLSKCFFYDQDSKLAFANFTMNNCIVNWKSLSNVAFNFNKSIAINFNLTNNTFYCLAGGTGNFIGMHGNEPKKITGFETEIGKFTIQNNTFYKIAYSSSKMLINTNSLKGKPSMDWIIKNNIFWETSGGSKKIYKNITNSSAAGARVTAADNVYYYDGVYWNELSLNSDAGIQIDPGFSMPGRGLFHPTNKSFPTTVGDLRWFEDAAKWQ